MMVRIITVTLYACLLNSQATAAPAAPDNITTLATSCAACHGPQGNSLGSTPSLAGLQPAYFNQRMQAFTSGTMPATVMHHHAKGLNEEEISALAAYFAMQTRQAPPKLPYQSFQGAQ